MNWQKLETFFTIFFLCLALIGTLFVIYFFYETKNPYEKNIWSNLFIEMKMDDTPKDEE